VHALDRSATVTGRNSVKPAVFICKLQKTEKEIKMNCHSSCRGLNKAIYPIILRKTIGLGICCLFFDDLIGGSVHFD
jgi:hypothetical protein